MSDARLTGTAKWFNAEKGYGFVRPEGRDGDVFLGSGAIEAAGIPEPQKISFVIGLDRQNRPRAEDIARVSDAAAERCGRRASRCGHERRGHRG